jgi:hypothetical protein
LAYRRVKNDFVDARDLADLLRMGRLPEAWIAPPAAREPRELVRHRAKLVHMCTSLGCHAPTRLRQRRGPHRRSRAAAPDTTHNPDANNSISAESSD